jgi:hypothetical protein
MVSNLTLVPRNAHLSQWSYLATLRCCQSQTAGAAIRGGAIALSVSSGSAGESYGGLCPIERPSNVQQLNHAHVRNAGQRFASLSNVSSVTSNYCAFTIGRQNRARHMLSLWVRWLQNATWRGASTAPSSPGIAT